MVNFLGPGAFDCARPAAVRPNFTPDNLPGDQDDWFQDCTSPLARDGTEWRSGLLNFLIANLRSLVRKSGLPVSNLDDDIVTRAVRKGHRYLAAVGGTANAITATLDPAITSYGEIEGTTIDLLITSPNTSSTVTLNFNGQGAVPVVRLDGSPLLPGDLRGPIGIKHVGSKFYLTTLPANAMRINGQCRMALDGAVLRLSRFNGTQIIVNGQSVTIPETGPTLASTGNANNTDYFIYAYVDGNGDLQLEKSTTGFTVGSDGIPVKTGDATRTHVGLAGSNGTGAWEDSFANRLIRSYFNREAKRGFNRFTADRSSAAGSGSPAEINTEIRCYFVCYTDDLVDGFATGYCFNSGASGTTYSVVTYDGTGTNNAGISAVFGTAGGPVAAHQQISGLSVGRHYATLTGYNSTGAGTWGGNTSSAPSCLLHVSLR